MGVRSLAFAPPILSAIIVRRVSTSGYFTLPPQMHEACIFSLDAQWEIISHQHQGGGLDDILPNFAAVQLILEPLQPFDTQ